MWSFPTDKAEPIEKVAECHFFDFFHPALAPMARPAPNAGKALLRKRFLRICRTPPRGPSLAPTGQFTLCRQSRIKHKGLRPLINPGVFGRLILPLFRLYPCEAHRPRLHWYLLHLPAAGRQLIVFSRSFLLICRISSAAYRRAPELFCFFRHASSLAIILSSMPPSSWFTVWNFPP